MDIESGTQSFVIKVWLEDTGEEEARATWRGHITHVPSGEKHYFKSPEEVTAFIASHLEAMGATPQPCPSLLAIRNAPLYVFPSRSSTYARSSS